MSELIEGLTVEELRRVFYIFLDRAISNDVRKEHIWQEFLTDIRQECTIKEVPDGL